MIASLVSAPRALYVAGLTAVIVGALSLAVPGVALSYDAPIENTHLLPEQDAAFRQAMAALDSPSTLRC